MFISRRRLSELLIAAAKLGYIAAKEEAKAEEKPGLTMDAFQVEAQRTNSQWQ